MRAQVTRTEVILEAGEQRGWTLRWAGVLRLRGPQQARLWLTRDGDRQDHWLAPGDTFRLRPGDRVWLGNESAHAIEVAVRTSHEAATPWTERLSGRSTLGARFADTLAPLLRGTRRGGC